MPSLKEVKNRISSVTSTQQITKAMKMVAAAKLRKAQDRIIQIRPYSQKLSALLSNVSGTITGDIENKYAEEREVNNVLIMVVTSDRGLCGAFNANVCKAVVALIKNKYAELEKQGKVKLLCVGKKGYDFFKRRDYNLLNDYVELFADLNFESAREAAEFAMNGFEEGTFDVVDLVYNEFKNVATQIVRTEQFLPIAKVENEEEDESLNLDYIFEPTKEEIIRDLIPYSLRIGFYKSLLESNAAEHGARMTAMSQATDNAQELLKQLKLTYNRSRQAAITKEILEIVGGAEALANG
ncbi:ATP synthase F1 subunit gamma [Flexithrix dorotheae]|uniref:ATP synthase F1 subunit gamma n=1 Tax=Flexithrix dorotheae TaxID=70993 RepID=UPI000361D2A2|nr:ATP synthase F1 subunit gamma [Flexithrix dorotheae]